MLRVVGWCESAVFHFFFLLSSLWKLFRGQQNFAKTLNGIWAVSRRFSKKKTLALGTILRIKSNHKYKRKKCLNQKDQRSGSIWVRRTPASACGACSRLFFFESFCFFLYARGEEEEDFPTLRQSFVGGADRFFSSSSFFLSFPRRKLLRNQRRFFFFARARESFFLVCRSGFWFKSAPGEKTQRESSHRREREEGARKREKKKLLKASFFPSFFTARII